MRFFKDIHIDFMGYWKWAVLGSLLLIAVGMASLIIKGPKYGIDFAGGTVVQVKFHDKVDIARIRKGLEEIKLGDSIIQQYGLPTNNEVLISLTKSSSSLEGLSEQIRKNLVKVFTDKGFEIRRVEMVGPRAGKDLRQKAMWAVIFAMIGMLLYAWWRFEFYFSVGAILALIHDTLMAMGALSLTNREFSLPVLAALLTIIGYSINDTIVVYDRIRENIRLNRGSGMYEIINESVNETLSRTFLTALTTFLVVISLFLFGGQVINDFAFTLLIGVVVGTYSSIFIASPVGLVMHEREKARAARQAAHVSEGRMVAHGAKASTSKIAAMGKAQKAAKDKGEKDPKDKAQKGA